MFGVSKRQGKRDERNRRSKLRNIAAALGERGSETGGWKEWREERYQGGRKISSLLKGTGLETQRKSSSSFFFAILLRNLWVICCRGKTFCLPPLKNRLN